MVSYHLMVFKLVSRNYKKKNVPNLNFRDVTGMVSQEEYEYSAFKCAFCKALNPAKKIRPIAPRLVLPDREKITGETSSKPLPSQSQQPSSSAPVTDKDSGWTNTIHICIIKDFTWKYFNVFVLFIKSFYIGSESDAVAHELRKRKETPSVESSAKEIETISEPMTNVDEPVSEINDDDKNAETSETVKTHNDKKNE